MATLKVRRLDANHDITFGRGQANYASGAEATAQRVRTRLLMNLGEWFIDTSAGVPWVQPEDSVVKPILGASGPRDIPYAEAVVKRTILGTDGVASLRSFTMSFDPETRRLSIAAEVVTDDDDIANIQVVSP